MPHDQELVQATRAWLLRADEDLQVVDVSLGSKRVLANAATFHAQQAAEKALTEYAWKSRYPGDWAPPSKDEAIQAANLSQVVFSRIVDRLPLETRP